ncbi:RagB/SusD family nutrient uptake outer membrane protein [Labilibacter marinus]|uniref:RagB/SusD family nutrient uptake outer membrane protein n=1 Tax=Labilibacter marinus TaxID=1477105 RepID=UPI00094F6190|nr:RagB/SusD family nutrient uptake outer membrane protein [Labilibacter marinus]
MKKLLYISAILTAFMVSACSDFLEVDPIARETEENFFETPDNAILAINGIYDVIGQSEGSGPDGQWLTHNYEFFFGDLLADDAEKGSKEADLQPIQDMVEWRSGTSNSVLESVWIKCFDGIYRANVALKWLPQSSLDAELKSRLEGEAYFLKGYFYFYMVRVFGGVPLFDEPVGSAEFGSIPRASYHETFEYAALQFEKAIERLPNKSEYASSDMGRATLGAAQGYLARLRMYQIGMDAESTVTYQEVKDLTTAIMGSGQYSLMTNYAQLNEFVGENASESIFELQMIEGSTANAPEKTGTNLNQFTGNRGDWGWGFQNPTQDLVDAFEDQDPRLSCSVYGPVYNGGVVQGMAYDYKLEEMMTPYLNRKTAMADAEKPSITKSSAYNIRKMRYTEILLLHAEVEIELGNYTVAEDIIESIRARARTSTMARGFAEGQLSYPSTGWGGNLPYLGVPAERDAAIDLLLKEKRVEMANEGLRFWDLVRHGKYLDMLDHKQATFTNNDGNLRYENVSLRANCVEKCIDGKNGVQVPLMPIPESEVNDWGLTQNKGY